MLAHGTLKIFLPANPLVPVVNTLTPTHFPVRGGQNNPANYITLLVVYIKD